jgi:hypothetical protein
MIPVVVTLLHFTVTHPVCVTVGIERQEGVVSSPDLFDDVNAFDVLAQIRKVF